MPAAVLDEPKVESVKATRIDSMITYPVSKGEIATLKAKFDGLSADSPKGYEQVRLAIGQCRELRVKIDKRRKELKADSLEFGRKVDSVAKFLTGEIEAIENPLQLAKDEVDDAKAREKLKKEQEAAAALEAKVKADREAEELRLKVIRDAEDARLKEERAKIEAERKEMEAKQKAIDEANRIEREKVEAERRKAEQEAKAKQAIIDAENKRASDEIAAKLVEAANLQAVIEAEQKRQAAILEKERQAIEAAKQKAEREEAERQFKLKAEAEAKEKAEQERLAKEKADAELAQWRESERVRLEAAKPDIEKLHAFGKQIRSLQCPGLASDWARDAVHTATVQLAEIAEVLESFQATIPY